MSDDERLFKLHERFSSHGPCKSILTGDIEFPERNSPVAEFNNARKMPEVSVKTKSGPYCSFHKGGKHRWRRNGFTDGLMKQRYDCACNAHGVAE